jgi:hypothetical protein
MSHTPGPWEVVWRTNACYEIEAPGQPGYSAKKVATTSLTNHEANASLIAAAPELLEALKEIFNSSTVEFSEEQWTRYGALIAKAEGEQP